MFKSFFDIEFRLEELDKAGDPLTEYKGMFVF